MNIDFEKDNYKFNARVSAIIYNFDKTKILLFKVEDGRDYYLLPGGRIELGENSKNAIKREIKEELGFELDYDLCSIQENFVQKNEKNIMQYCFCYKTIYNGNIDNEKIICKDNADQSFYWININEINKYKIFPNSTYQLINNNKVEHIIEENK